MTAAAVFVPPPFVMSRLSHAVVIVLLVVLGHALALWALHHGLLQRAVPVLVPARILIDLVPQPAAPVAETLSVPVPAAQPPRQPAAAQPALARPAPPRPAPRRAAAPTPVAQALSVAGAAPASTAVPMSEAPAVAPGPAARRRRAFTNPAASSGWTRWRSRPRATAGVTSPARATACRRQCG